VEETRQKNKARSMSVWPPFPSLAFTRRPSKFLPFPLNEPGCRLFARARHGLWHGLLALGLERGDGVLVPACHEGSEVEAVLQAGMTSRFYDANESLEPDESELEALLGPRVRALLLTHHLGFPQDARRWRRFCDRHGLALIEDAAQAWLATIDGHPAGSFGDLSIFSLHNTYGLPDGAPLLIRSHNDSDPVGRTRRKSAQWAVVRAEATAWLAALAVGAHREPFPREEGIALGNPRSSPSSVTLFLLPRVVDEGTAACRRANYSMLLDELIDVVPAAFARLPEGACPFVFPVEIRPKTDLRERLAELGVDAHELWWPPHPTFPSAHFPGAAALRRRVIGLPVHQELRLEEVERLVSAIRRRRSRSPTPRLEFLPTLESARMEWTELATSSRNIFATWEWNSIWWRHFGEGRALLATACRTAGSKLEAILPLYFWSVRPLRVIRFLGHGAGNELGPVCGRAARTTAARALRNTLAAVDCDVFFGEELPGAAGWPALLGAKVHRRFGDPLIRLEAEGWEDFLASRSSNFRQQVRRRERKLARDHALAYRLANEGGRLKEDLDILFRLHRARWGDRQSSFAANEAFHREFAARALELDWLRLWFLELDGEPVAAWYGFRFCGVESYYQAGRDPAWTDSTIGLVLLAHSIREALNDGMDTYRLGRGATPYKSRFATEDPGLEAVVLARSVFGATAVTGGHIARSFRPLKTALKAPLDI
jgi:CelD/BcsL family acetyltransferase involved in cellulose biosynthesis